MRSSSDDSSRSSGALHDEHAAAFIRRKAPIVEIVAVERDERAPELLREPVVLQVGRAPQLVFLEHEQDVPVQARTHVSDEPGGHVRVRVDARPGREVLGVRRELTRKSAHGKVAPEFGAEIA